LQFVVASLFAGARDGRPTKKPLARQQLRRVMASRADLETCGTSWTTLGHYRRGEHAVMMFNRATSHEADDPRQTRQHPSSLCFLSLRLSMSASGAPTQACAQQLKAGSLDCAM
jgi:hypothetical protein